MATNLAMELAVEGDEISLEALSSAIEFCNEQADALNDELKARIQAGDAADELAELRDLRNAYRARALELAAQSIKLQAGEAKISAEHIASAVAAAQKTIDAIKKFKDRLAKLGAVLDFFSTVLTGNGRAIVEGATTLKEALEA
jgi:hypothetical protein